MRTCQECGNELPDEAFDYRGGDRKGLQATCKPCSRERLRKHRRKMRKLVDEYKMAAGCAVCGFNESPFALHLDHLVPSEKRNRGKAGRALEVSWSEKRIREELGKCQVLCANHHAIKTFENGDHLTE
jgi:hypothetical protein